ncbi:hypothetical protein N8I77_009520 [Diaporthe amygdali]|uniref:PH domain-containing protein n=1 Tax=Phomopsis amygdali TaxID=1214568 RepID=A0AAD9W0K2_PHOAM|nr:hypothetical protein N8I77_009520 [Diaporthe amygdali]
MEGYLAVPPDRGTILGRALWKTRYVVLGSASQREVKPEDSPSQAQPGARGKDGRGTSRSQSNISFDGTTYLSIYKASDDREPIQQYAVSTIAQCQVQMVAHRKQGPVLPTLIVTIVPDPATDKLRKRRSSRAAGLVASSRESGPMSLWFRAEEVIREGQSLHDWARAIQATIQPNMPDVTPMSPMSPGSNSFNNPFTQRQPRDASEFYPNRPPSAPKSSLQHKSSTATGSSRERPLTFSDTPSLRSRRSDISSLTGINVPPLAPHTYASVMPSDLPSPATTAGGHYGGFIEGWTSAQGRSSTLSSPVRNVRDSMGSMPPFSPPATIESGSPPNARETILDRAFQLHCIPGSDQQIPGEEKLSSLARFEALMQQADEQRKGREQRPQTMVRRPASPPASPPHSLQQPQLRSAWDLDDSSDDNSVDSDSDSTHGDSGYGQEEDMEEDPASIRARSRRTLGYVSGRRTPPGQSQSPRSTTGPRSPIAFNPETLMALNSGSNLGRGSSNRPVYAQRSYSQTQITGLSGLNLSVSQQALDASPGRSSVTSRRTSIQESVGGLNPAAALYRTSTIAEGQKRQSVASNSSKRLSFTEFTRRLSSTGSLLLNASPSGETEAQPAGTPRSAMQPRGPPSLFNSPNNDRGHSTDRNARDQACSNWRNGAGVLGGEGGFL